MPDLLTDYTRIIRARRAELPPAYEQAMEIAGRITGGAGRRASLRPCHNDLLRRQHHPCRDSGRVMLVDWEYAGMGHPWFDLGNLSVNNDFLETTDNRLLAGLPGRGSLEAQAATLKLMRVISDVREGAWGVMQATGVGARVRLRGLCEPSISSGCGRRPAGPSFERWLAAVGG